MKMNITRETALNIAIAALRGEDVSEMRTADAAACLENIKATIAKANSRKSDKPTKTQVENTAIKAQLLTHITAEGVRCGDLATAVGISGQKASALLSQMVREGTCRKVEGAKRVTLFALPAEG